MSGLSYDFAQQNFDPSPAWDHSSLLGQSPQSLPVERSLPDEASGSLWRTSDSPLMSPHQALQFPLNSSAISMTPPLPGGRDAFGSQGLRDDQMWQHTPAPIRSMSLVSPAELPPHYQARHFQQHLPSSRRISATSAVPTSSVYGHTRPDADGLRAHLATESNPLAQQPHPGQASGFAFPQWSSYPGQNTAVAESGDSVAPHEWYSGSHNPT